MELRCLSKKFGELTPDGVIEIKCPSRFCGAAPGIVVIHQFAPETGKLLDTKKFRDPVPVTATKEVQ